MFINGKEVRRVQLHQVWARSVALDVSNAGKVVRPLNAKVLDQLVTLLVSNKLIDAKLLQKVKAPDKLVTCEFPVKVNEVIAVLK